MISVAPFSNQTTAAEFFVSYVINTYNAFHEAAGVTASQPFNYSIH